MKSIVVMFFIAVVTGMPRIEIEDTDETYNAMQDWLTTLEERTMSEQGIGTLVDKANALKTEIAKLHQQQSRLRHYLLLPVRNMENKFDKKENEQAKPSEHVFQPSDFGNLLDRCFQITEQLQGFSSKITV